MKLLVLFASLTFAGSVGAHADFYNNLESDIEATTTLANLSVGYNMRRYTVRVRDCGNNVSHVLLRVLNSGVYVNGAGVNYADGGSQSFNVSQTFDAGYNSGWVGIDSFRNGRCPTSVFVNAQSTDPQRPSRVQVLGNTRN